jgi:hypothetical protein
VTDINTTFFEPPRVLLIEHDESLSRFLVWALESAGCRVATALNAAEAAADLLQLRPDVIVYHDADSLSPAPGEVRNWQGLLPECRVVRVWQRSPSFNGEPRHFRALDVDAELEMPFEIQELPDLVITLAREARRGRLRRLRPGGAFDGALAPARTPRHARSS